ncbi:hypothetical protein [Cloacibacillus evryensis]|uniref:hypothetical protein n=1 Tax=Cloacibacillus evryensis TaxID=508460 RepID=UPI00241F907E|nr:hypothetical protein [Cloacibacillus evryensis]
MQDSSIILICNRALNLMGCGRAVSSLDESSDEAQALKRFYDAALVTLLQRADWNFARGVEVLAQCVDNAVPGFLYTYKYPNGCVKVRRILSADPLSHGWTKDFQTALDRDGSRVVCSGVYAASCEYTALMKDPAIYPALFEEALCWNLARMACWVLADVSAGMRKEISQQFLAAFADASQADANEGHLTVRRSCDYIDKR